MIIVPGSCGELAQGLLDYKDVLITCPVSMYTRVKVILNQKPTSSEREQNIKAYKAVDSLLDNFCIRKNYYLKIDSDLPRGKGMASSSADIAAACFAMAKKLYLPISAKSISEIALKIEPTDGVFFDGIVAFDHIKGQICEFLGTPPAISIAVFDFGGRIDTLAFNKRLDLKQLKSQSKDAFKEAYDLIVEGIKTQNPVLIGKGATISALSNQAILPKKDLEKIMLIGNKYDSLGISIAHSGTVAGIMFDKNKEQNIVECIKNVAQDCPTLQYITTTKLISGGIYNEAML